MDVDEMSWRRKFEEKGKETTKRERKNMMEGSFFILTAMGVVTFVKKDRQTIS